MQEMYADLVAPDRQSARHSELGGDGPLGCGADLDGAARTWTWCSGSRARRPAVKRSSAETAQSPSQSCFLNVVERQAAVLKRQIGLLVTSIHQLFPPPGSQRAVADEWAAAADSRPVCGGQAATKSQPAQLISPFSWRTGYLSRPSQVRRVARTPVN